MLCQRCEEREASVHLTKIVNGEKTELFLCEKCAKETGQIPLTGNNPFSFQNLLAGILNPDIGSINNIQSEQDCTECGMSYKEFTQQGLFGCAECYETFSNRLDPLLKRIHGSNKHNGKVPKRRGATLRVKRDLEDLRRKLQLAVEKEEFEQAAELRDKIHELEDKLGGS